MSLLDLLLAKALVEGLARANMPDNFKVLRPNSASWRGLKEVCKNGNNVIAVEVTKDENRRTQQAFVKLAREHGELTFFRAEIDESGYTFPELREDLGDIRFTPTFVFAFFNDDGTQYAKFEGESEIMSAVDSGRIDAIIKELMSRRTKLKMVDGMAELAAKMMVMKLVGAMAEDSSEKEERGRTVCELCKGSFSNPVTYHMKSAHPGCGRSCGASGYNATGAYSKSGWLGDCGDGGRGMSTWY
eukprot:Em0010g298a